MNRFDTIMGKFNFRKAVILYLTVSILAGILSIGFLAYIFRDRLALTYGYYKLSEQAGGESGFESLKPELNRLAASSPDLTDILILDGENRILFSAKRSELSKKGSLNLAAGSGEQSRYLTDPENPDVHFRLLEGDKLDVAKEMLGIDEEAERDYQDRYFHEKNYDRQKAYLLSYLIDEPGGEKVYFISDIRPVAGGRFCLKAAAALAVLIFMVYWVLLALWVYARALKAKMNAAIWGIVTLFTNLAGWFVFLLYRQGRRICPQCGALQSRSGAFCTFCGARLGGVCPRCHTPVSEKDRYCGHCGSALDGKKDRDE